MAHVFVLQGGERLYPPLLGTIVHHRALLLAAALTVSGALGGYALAYGGDSLPASPCVHAVGALGPYGIANGSGTTVSDPGCNAAP